MTRRLIDVLYNFYWVDAGRVARSAQPYLGFWRRYLTGNGIAAILNLRGRHDGWHWWKREVAVCRKLGIQHYDRAMNSRRLPDRDRLLALLNIYDAAQKPLMVKCSGGQDRTSFVSALFLIHRYGWEAQDRALGQFARFPYLHFPKRHQRWLKQFLIYACDQAAGQPLSVWLRSQYTPEAFAKWLEARGLGDSYFGLYSGQSKEDMAVTP